MYRASFGLSHPARILIPQVLAAFAYLLSVNAATFTVVNTSDSGAGSLRQAILNANTNSDLDTINFQIPGSPPFVISLAAPLNPLGFPTIIDATTQPGYVGAPLVELNGTSVAASLAGLQLSGGNSAIRGLAINRFNAAGILLSSSGNTIQANRIGTDITGLIARPNSQPGIYIQNNNNLIGGTDATNRNIISGNAIDGIYIQNSSGNVVQGNYIGVNATGVADLGNVNNGIVIYDTDGAVASSNLIGGTITGARNVISGNDGSGISLFGGGAAANLIQGNYIGVNATGTAAISNSADGITLDNAPGNMIGGSSANARNLISGNGKVGIFLSGANAKLNRIEGNHIGTDVNGLLAVGNNRSGILSVGAPSNNIGSSVSGALNLISGNKQDGIFLTNSAGNRIQGNYIGLNISGAAALPNTDSGVSLDNSPANLVGGGLPGERNVISGNGGIGVWLRNPFSSANQVKGNFIGTSASGTAAVSNPVAGLGLTEAPGNTIGGVTAGERNVISGNGSSISPQNGGVFMFGANASGNALLGNYIGVNASGQTALKNHIEGIYIDAGKSNVIGSEIPGGGNIISANGTRAIFLNNASWNTIKGNLIGVAADGETGMSNGTGFATGFSLIDLTASSNNTIGGTNAGAGNRIAFAPVLATTYYAGVRVRETSLNNSVLGNAIFSNGGLGIDIHTYGLTGNDTCDGDSGGNLQQNFPVLIDAVSAGNIRVRGYLLSASGQTYRLQFFSNSSCDSSPTVSGYGEGKSYLGQISVTLGGACSNSFTALLPATVPAGSFITATATDAAGNTSEFSACVSASISIVPRLSITNVSTSQLSIAWTNTAPGFALKQTTNLSAPVIWSPVTNSPVLVSGQYVVTLPYQPGNRFYVLQLE